MQNAVCTKKSDQCNLTWFNLTLPQFVLFLLPSLRSLNAIKPQTASYILVCLLFMFSMLSLLQIVTDCLSRLYLYVCPFVYLFVCLSDCFSVCLFVCLFVCLPSSSKKHSNSLITISLAYLLVWFVDYVQVTNVVRTNLNCALKSYIEDKLFFQVVEIYHETIKLGD